MGTAARRLASRSIPRQTPPALILSDQQGMSGAVSRLEDLQSLVRANFEQLRSRFPELFQAGGCLLLGRQYAHPASRVLVLGINPGPSESAELDVRRQDFDFLIDGPAKPRHQNWTNARKFFNASPRVLEVVRLATFAFCCPYRTAAWSSLPQSVKTALADSSRAILTKIVQDCRAQLIIITGVDGFRLFAEIMNRSLEVKSTISRGGDGRLHQWAAYAGELEGQRVIVAQVPHFSRAGESAKLRECAAWLASVNDGPGHVAQEGPA